jgi:uncharacterized protein (UPF0332 family)
MTRWRNGETVIERLLNENHLERVPADPDVATNLVEIATRHAHTAAQAAPSDPDGALAMAYDAIRKAATALLAHQGLRPTSRGGHIAVVDATEAQFPNVPGLRSLDRLRRRRNQAEYPDPARYGEISTDEANDAATNAEHACNAASQLLDRPELGVF